MGELEDDIQTRAEIGLTRLLDDCASTDPLAPYQALIREWAMAYLTAPHPELGREGPVCPFVAPSIHREMFWVGCVDGSDLAVEDIERTVAATVARFNCLAPKKEPETFLKTILILFPALTDYGVIDEAQKRLKEESIALGLMIGQFYPGCKESGIRNPEFKPLQSPLPLLAIRPLVGSDLPFLVTRVGWVEEYLKRFAPSIPAPMRSLIAAKFATQRTEAPYGL